MQNKACRLLHKCRFMWLLSAARGGDVSAQRVSELNGEWSESRDKMAVSGGSYAGQRVSLQLRRFRFANCRFHFSRERGPHARAGDCCRAYNVRRKASVNFVCACVEHRYSRTADRSIYTLISCFNNTVLVYVYPFRNENLLEIPPCSVES